MDLIITLKNSKRKLFLFFLAALLISGIPGKMLTRHYREPYVVPKLT
ncbi:MAG: hypothetical protein PHY99_08825 [Bacteroidales bacterium]|nr:hypothetical protein [Bacteroidales bacterium]